MKKRWFILLPLLFASPVLAEEAASVASTMSLLTKGLIVTVGGLGGVFLVLVLFYLTIKAMKALLK